MKSIKQQLIDRGAKIIEPDSVYIGEDLVLEQISRDLTVMPASRISGARTSIGAGTVVGAEGPLSIIDSQIGNNVQLAGGFISGASILDNARVGSGAHIRPASILEEYSSCAHSVGLKQSILMPFVTLGSLVNLCDCLMAGGQGKDKHSEVGSSYVHFNFTPRQDKATASLIGDVVNGVMLDQEPIFLGGQGGLVGPVRIAYGATIPAGIIYRAAKNTAGSMAREAAPLKNFNPNLYIKIKDILEKNIDYIANIHALYDWYKNVRKVLQKDTYQQLCIIGALNKLDSILEERLTRLAQLQEKVGNSLKLLPLEKIEISEEEYYIQNEFVETWPSMRLLLEQKPSELRTRDIFLEGLGKDRNGNALEYPAYIRSLPVRLKKLGISYLEEIRSSYVEIMPPIK